MFALFMDIGLVPFYVFIALFANNNYQEAPGNKDRWTSFFTAPGATTTLLLVTFIAAASVAGLHLLSGIFDLWLVILFRKISKLPPDMNPLEDNLTSGGPRARKHKHKNSEATPVECWTEKNPGYYSGSTVSVDQRSRLSTATKDGETSESRQVPFRHSRNGSQAVFSPHNPESARLSRQHFEENSVYQQSYSARGSRNDFRGHSRAETMTTLKGASIIETDEAPPPPRKSSARLNSPRPSSHPESRSNTDLGRPARYSSPALPNAAPSTALVKSQQKAGLLDDNWYSLDDESSDIGTPSRQRTPAPALQFERNGSFEPQPLKMHPPTPPQKQIEYPDPEDEEPDRLQAKRNALTDRRDFGNGDLNRHLTVQSNVTTTSSVYSESSPSLKSGNSPGTPKGRYYGDLAAATRGVRGVKSNDTIQSNGTVGASGYDSTGFSALGGYGYSSPSPPRMPPLKSIDTIQSYGTVGAAGYDSTGFSALGDYGYSLPSPPRMKKSSRRDGNGRVLSRTGADIADAQALYPSDVGYGMRGRRDVSGKVAEEGRGGRWESRKRY